MNRNFKDYGQPAFVLCVLVLAVSGLGMSVMKDSLGGYLTKTPLLLQRSLDELDASMLAPFEVIVRQKIESEEIVASLGTEDYIQWVLADANDALGTGRVMVFVTYYRLPDRVPHVPEECYMGGGFQRLATEAMALDLGDVRLDARYLVFGSAQGAWQGQARVPVVYFFKVNGRFAADRDEARMLLNKNVFGQSSYFSKVELVFNQQAAPVTRDQVVHTSQRVLQRLLPVLEQDHWPNLTVRR
ncbi:MAG: exosortase-associated EpsI family protein [Planctomycetes bacterium]|nr:exosortase-associated EpsI family protein [Planctomycetota bacterium]